MIVARFSNGFTDTYKGTRPVKAAWMITNKDTGEVFASGHSLDREKAQATAENTASGGSYWIVPKSAMWAHPRWVAHSVGLARKAGLFAADEKVGVAQLMRALKADNAKRRAEKRAQYRIEVVDL